MTFKARMVATLAAATLTFISSPVLRAQEASHKLIAMDEFQLQLPTDPQISPDGKRIVYVRRFADPMTDKRYLNLWIINTDGTDHRPITTPMAAIAATSGPRRRVLRNMSSDVVNARIWTNASAAGTSRAKAMSVTPIATATAMNTNTVATAVRFRMRRSGSSAG